MNDAKAKAYRWCAEVIHDEWAATKPDAGEGVAIDAEIVLIMDALFAAAENRAAAPEVPPADLTMVAPGFAQGHAAATDKAPAPVLAPDPTHGPNNPHAPQPYDPPAIVAPLVGPFDHWVDKATLNREHEEALRMETEREATIVSIFGPPGCSTRPSPPAIVALPEARRRPWEAVQQMESNGKLLSRYNIVRPTTDSTEEYPRYEYFDNGLGSTKEEAARLVEGLNAIDSPRRNR